MGKQRDRIRRTIDERLWPLVINYVLRQARDNSLATRLSQSKKIVKIADRQDRLLVKLHRKAAKVIDEIKVPGWITFMHDFMNWLKYVRWIHQYDLSSLCSAVF